MVRPKNRGGRIGFALRAAKLDDAALTPREREYVAEWLISTGRVPPPP
jgi:hypothetical protein